MIKGAKPLNFPKSSTLPETGERWIEKFFHLVFNAGSKVDLKRKDRGVRKGLLIIATWDDKGMETKEQEVRFETMKCEIYDIDRDDAECQQSTTEREIQVW
jgi:hypothetical protein